MIPAIPARVMGLQHASTDSGQVEIQGIVVEGRDGMDASKGAAVCHLSEMGRCADRCPGTAAKRGLPPSPGIRAHCGNQRLRGKELNVGLSEVGISCCTSCGRTPLISWSHAGYYSCTNCFPNR
jgi:hypothetical protein